MNRPKSHVYHKIYCDYYGLTGIPEGYVVHHIDGDPWNNNIDNLQMMTRAEHTILHNLGNTYMRGKKLNDNTKLKMRNSRLGQPGWNKRNITEDMIEDAKVCNAREFRDKYNCAFRVYYRARDLKKDVAA